MYHSVLIYSYCFEIQLFFFPNPHPHDTVIVKENAKVTNHAVIINTDYLLFLLEHFLSSRDKSFLCVS